LCQDVLAAGHRSRARRCLFLLPANTHGHLPRGLPRNVTKDAGAGLFSVCMCTASCGLAALHSLVRGRRRVYLAEVAVSGWWRPCTKELRVLVLRHAVLGFYLALARRFRLEAWRSNRGGAVRWSRAVVCQSCLPFERTSRAES
jgi:hypothetical protein